MPAFNSLDLFLRAGLEEGALSDRAVRGPGQWHHAVCHHEEELPHGEEEGQAFGSTAHV